jgi:hypothetical protein
VLGPARKREQRLTLIILLIAGLVRIPFLWRGFGGHPDEWYLIRSGLDFWLNGIYRPSRPAGYPLNELMMGGLAWLGRAPACAAAATAASLAALAYMRWLAPLHGIGGSFWLVLACRPTKPIVPRERWRRLQCLAAVAQAGGIMMR